jgi:UDP:flavonoid glycosyltransferase YjiC (YdhE family)
MRVLFGSGPGLGHLLPLLPLASAARDAGHDVVVATGAGLAPILGSAGFAHLAVGPATLGEAMAPFPELADLVGAERVRFMIRHVFGQVVAEAMASGVLALAADWRPDVVVHEDMEFGTWIAAERLGIPSASVQVVAWRPHVRGTVATSLNPLRETHGLAADPELRGLYGSLFFTTRPPALRDPGPPMPFPLAELRPEPEGDQVPADPEADHTSWLNGAHRSRPRVAVTLGTVNAHRHDILRPILDGLAGHDVDVVVGLGADPVDLGNVAANIRVERYVPMSRLLPASDAVVFHAGSGTMLSALAAGIPLVMVPLAADQPENAERGAAAGVGRVVHPAELTPDSARRAVDDVLGDPRYLDRARVVAVEIAAMPGPAEAVERIEQVAETGSA